MMRLLVEKPSGHVAQTPLDIHVAKGFDLQAFLEKYGIAGTNLEVEVNLVK